MVKEHPINTREFLKTLSCKISSACTCLGFSPSSVSDRILFFYTDYFSRTTPDTVYIKGYTYVFDNLADILKVELRFLTNLVKSMRDKKLLQECELTVLLSRINLNIDSQAVVPWHGTAELRHYTDGGSVLTRLQLSTPLSELYNVFDIIVGIKDIIQLT